MSLKIFFGSLLSELPCSLARSRIRMASRSLLTARMRAPRVSGMRYGQTTTMVEKKTEIAAIIAMIRSILPVIPLKSMAASDIKVDHLAHHHGPDQHPNGANGQNDIAGLGGEEERDIGRGGHEQGRSDEDRN